jgi:hypothetical protein
MSTLVNALNEVGIWRVSKEDEVEWLPPSSADLSLEPPGSPKHRQKDPTCIQTNALFPKTVQRPSMEHAPVFQAHNAMTRASEH